MQKYGMALALILSGALMSGCGDDEDDGSSTNTGGTGNQGGVGNLGGVGNTGNMGGGGAGNMGGGGAGNMGGGGEGGVPGDVCGDGSITGSEACDDGGTTAGDGCDASCAVELGWECTGEPSACATVCGDGEIAGTEECDDDGVENLDGCNSMCAIESGWACDGKPSLCTTTCGDGLIGEGGEGCDDGGTTSGDGCADDCTIETGFSCDGQPSVCMTSCGDGLIAGTEACDDAGMVDGDGCSSSCAIESGYVCNGEPSVCEVAGTCAAPIVATDGFVFQAPNLLAYGDDLQNADGSCSQPSSTPGEHPDLVFQVDLGIGDTLHVAESGAADVLFHVLDGACDSASACLESFDGIGASEINPGLVYQATTSGTYFVVIDSWTSNPSMGATIDLLFEISPCGDGLVGTGEGCDDMGTTDGDGCSATCQVEPGYVCTGEPSVCSVPPGMTCADPVVVNTNPFQLTGASIAAYGNSENYNPGASCVDVGATGGNNIIFQVALGAGETVRMRELTSFDAVLHILTPGQCSGGSACVASTDISEVAGITYTAAAAETVFLVAENWGSSGNNVPFDIVIDTWLCGDNVVEGPESCDDGGTTSGDGCSATCQCEDIDCVLGTCAGTVVTGSATGLPAGIPDNQPAGGAVLTIPIAATGTIQSMAMEFGATHPFVGDVDIWLTSPAGGAELDVCTDNGSTGDNFIGTIFGDGSPPITGGVPPFTGAFSPEQPFSTYDGQSVSGTWTLRVADDAGGDVGEVTAWNLAFCVTP